MREFIEPLTTLRGGFLQVGLSRFFRNSFVGSRGLFIFNNLINLDKIKSVQALHKLSEHANKTIN